MKLAIMQPYFMPYIGYFQAISAVDKYILYSNLTFIKDAWMNRNRIRLKNGKVQTISVPLLHKSSNTLIYDTLVDNGQKWQEKLLKTLLLNYKGSKGFDEAFPLFQDMLSIKYETLTELNAETLRAICQFLGISTIIESDNSRFLDMENQLTEYDADKSVLPRLVTQPEKKVARVLEMCRLEDCHDFVNAIGGQALYDKEEFAKYGVQLSFVHTNEFEYEQFGLPFEPNLSIIDVLMFNGKEGTKRLLQEYTLV